MILLKNATYIHWETLDFQQADILVHEGVDGEIQINPEAQQIQENNSGIQVIDCSGKLVTKSFAVGHHHVYSALARGMGAPAKNPENFREILQYIWWNLDQALDKDMVEASALAIAMASAKAGSTFVIDHHASPNFLKGSLEVIAHAFEKVGISHLLNYEITDRYGEARAIEALDETESYLQNNQALVGLHASFTVGNQTLKRSAELAEKYNSGIHIHVAEDKYDQEHCMENYRKRVIDRLNDYGVLDSPKSILGHCLFLDHTERERLRNSRAWIVENIESNLNNGVGHFNSAGLGDRIFLGTDGMHSDMIRSAQWAFFAGKEFDNIDFASAYKRFRNVHRYLSENIFKGDGDNNLVVLDYDSPTVVNSENFLGHFIFGLNSNHIQHVISDGKLIVKDKAIQTVNENDILEFTREHSVRLWKAMK